MPTIQKLNSSTVQLSNSLTVGWQQKFKLELQFYAVFPSSWQPVTSSRYPILIGIRIAVSAWKHKNGQVWKR